MKTDVGPVSLTGSEPFFSFSLPWPVGQESLRSGRGPSVPSVARPVALRLRLPRCSGQYTLYDVDKNSTLCAPRVPTI